MRKTLFWGVAFLFIISGFISNTKISQAATASLTNTQAQPSAEQVKVTDNVQTTQTTQTASPTSGVTSQGVPKLTSTTTVSATSQLEPVKNVVVAPPPAYIQTGQTLETKTNVSATTSKTGVTATTTSTTETPTVSAPTNVPQELPADQGMVTPEFTVTSVVVTETKISAETSTTTAKVIEFQGKAKPNTYVTLYIYSTPIIVTVKTDSEGNWKYSLDQELDDGVHKIYVAQIDNTGSVVAKSDPIFFNKAAASVEVVASGILPNDSSKVNFFQQYFIAIALGVLVVAIIIGLIAIGLVKRKGAEVAPESAPEPTPEDNIQ